MALTKVTYNMIENAVYDVTNYGADPTGTNDSAAAIQSAIAAAGATNGNIVYLPPGTYKINSTLDIPYSGVVLVGAGSGSTHDIGTLTGTTATRLLWGGSAGGTMVKIYSPAGGSNEKQNGCGVQKIMLDANGAGIGIEIISQNNGKYQDLFFLEFATACISMNVATSLGETKDPQQNMFDTIQCRQFLTTGSCFIFDGDAISNTSMNLFQNIDLNIKDGNGIVFNNSDNNIFVRTRVFRAGGGTGTSVLFNGSNSAADQVARANSFIYYSSGVPAVGKGTSSFTYPSYDNSIYYADQENGSPSPIVETGSSVWFSTENNIQFKLGSVQACFADNYNFAKAQRDLMTTESVRIYNNSSNHARLVSNGAEWSITINDSTGDLRITRISGTGLLDLPSADGSSMRFGTQVVSGGAPDSGGVGYRMIRVPN